MSRQLAERGEACLIRLSLAHARGGSQDEERVLTTAPSPSPSLSLSLALALALAVDVQQFSRCQIARSILYCSIIIVGPSEEAKSQVQGSHEYELLNLPKRQRAKRKVL